MPDVIIGAVKSGEKHKIKIPLTACCAEAAAAMQKNHPTLHNFKVG